MSVMLRRAFTVPLSLDCKSQFRSPIRKCSTFSESNLPNNVLMCVKSSWSEFGGLYHEVITNGFELCLRISIDIISRSSLSKSVRIE